MKAASRRKAAWGIWPNRVAAVETALCSLPSAHFTPLPDEPDLAVDELGHLLPVVQWVGGAP